MSRHLCECETWLSRSSPARVLVLLATGLVLMNACTTRRPPGNDTTPVILISVDTLRADRLNCYGYSRRQTSPSIDALAKDGILVETHIAASPWTTPSHLTMLTSLPPTRHGVLSSFDDIASGLRGESEFERLPDSRLTLTEALKSKGRVTAAFTGGVTLDPQLGFGQGFDSYDVSMVKLGPRPMAALTHWIGEQRQTPFFLFWHTFEVHAPYTSGRFLRSVLRPEDAGRLQRGLGRLARQAQESSIGSLVEKGRRLLQRHHCYRAEVCDALYDGGVRSFDSQLGELVRILQAAQIYDSSLIVLTSDHGEELDEHGRGFYNLHGRGLYEELVHVPLIIKLPRQQHAGTRLAGVTSALDLMPTILDTVGATPHPNEMEGVSLRPRWEQGASPANASAISEALSKGEEQKGLRTDAHKLIVTIARDVVAREGRAHMPADFLRRELFDLGRDPEEMINLLEKESGETSHEAEADRMENELRSRLGTPGRAEKTQLGEDAMERLRSLGYLD